MKGFAIRVDNSGQNALDGAAYSLAPDPMEIMFSGTAPKTAAWMAKLELTVKFILGFTLASTTKLLFLTGAHGGVGGSYLEAQGGTFEKVPSVKTSTIENSVAITSDTTSEAIVRWVVGQVESKLGKQLTPDVVDTSSSSSGLSATSSSSSSPTSSSSSSAAAPSLAAIAQLIHRRERATEDRDLAGLNRYHYADLGVTDSNWWDVVPELEKLGWTSSLS